MSDDLGGTMLLTDRAWADGSVGRETLKAAGLEVLAEHPASIVTPHIAFSSDASVTELRRTAAEEVARALRGDSPVYPYNEPASITRGMRS